VSAAVTKLITKGCGSEVLHELLPVLAVELMAIITSLM
jgi:hypothetical protein